MDIIEKIRTEIERRIKLYSITNEKEQWIVNTYWSVLSFLSTLESEKPNTHLEHVPEIKETGTQGLDEAAKNYALNTAEDSEQYSARYLGYKDGAKWQKEQDDKELSEKIAAAYQLGIADKEKQMMKEAVEGEVMDFSSNQPRPQVDVLLDPHKYHTGDKVRVMVCKKEDEK